MNASALQLTTTHTRARVNLPTCKPAPRVCPLTHRFTYIYKDIKNIAGVSVEPTFTWFTALHACTGIPPKLVNLVRTVNGKNCPAQTGARSLRFSMKGSGTFHSQSQQRIK
jgi:hypothetical protein